jgi:hypothetical protein
MLFEHFGQNTYEGQPGVISEEVMPFNVGTEIHDTPKIPDTMRSSKNRRIK